MRSGRAGPYFSMWKSMQKTFKGILPLKIPLSRAVQRRFVSLRSLDEPYWPLHLLCADFWQGISIHASDEQWRKPRSARDFICFQFCTGRAGDLKRASLSRAFACGSLSGRFPKEGTSFGGFCQLFGSEKLGPARPEREKWVLNSYLCE